MESAAQAGEDLAPLLIRARSGLRSEVAPLAAALREARLYIPLSKSMADVEVGVETEVDGELSIAPHLIVDSDELSYLVAFSSPERLQAVAAQMGWRTSGGDLEFCALPGQVVFEIALQIVDGQSVVGMLLDAMAESELMLQRHEVASLAQGKALPLVGYVGQIPESPEDKTLVAELGEPPPKEITDVVDAVLADQGLAVRYALSRTFNAERDLEPHWTLTLGGPDGADSIMPLAETIAEALEGKLPPPGYIDILFDEELGA